MWQCAATPPWSTPLAQWEQNFAWHLQNRIVRQTRTEPRPDPNLLASCIRMAETSEANQPASQPASQQPAASSQEDGRIVQRKGLLLVRKGVNVKGARGRSKTFNMLIQNHPASSQPASH